MKTSSVLFTLCSAVSLIEAKSLWASTPARWSHVIEQAYQLGNGKLGGMPFGPAGGDKVVINIDSLWTGGPFESASYNGGNPKGDVSKYLPGIRDEIWKNGTGNVKGLLGDASNYGSYRGYGNLSVAISGVTSTTSYKRSLDLDNGIHTTVYTANDGNTYTSIVYCTYPDQVCVYSLSSTAVLPEIAIKLEQQLADPSLVNSTCGDQYVRLAGVTQSGPPVGMKYDGIARLMSRTNGTNGTSTAYCSKTAAGTLIIPATSRIRSFSLVIGAETNYNQRAGNAANNYSFKGVDPGAHVEAVTLAAAAKPESDILKAYISDYQSLSGAFTFTVPDTLGSAKVETSALISRYLANGTGDPYLESVILALGRHLLITSSRINSLPPNLQGRWAEGLKTAWGADYHANINMQMNLWGADATGIGKLQISVWNYMENTWVPRGTETAKLLYNATGWVTHNEMNIFGHTGMKGTAQWANYPASAAWMMHHVYDHYLYFQNKTWFEAQGFPLMKGVAQFWLSQLQEDTYTKDGTLVVNPCNSPEHGPTTFACTHWQQLINELFNGILASSALPSVAADAAFLSSVKAANDKLDKGLHFTSWGGIKEWKLDDTDPRYPYDIQGDTHRHLSHLVGWYPGYSISGTAGGYTNTTIQSAISKALISRGAGNGPDANAGWEKVWRSACWAMLNNTEQAHYELRYALNQNFAGNGLSMYSGHGQPFQIDANFGFVGAVVAMLSVDLPGMDAVVLGPAIPASWSPGQVKGLNLRGGGSVDFSWDANGTVTAAQATGGKVGLKIVNKAGKVLL